MIDTEISFGTWVRRRRKALDLTRQELARQLGCSTSLIFKIESDERRPSRQMAELLARHLQIPQDQRQLFLKIARQEKSTENLDAIPAPSTIEPLPVAERFPSNLPIPPSPLIGREHETAMIVRQLREPACRMLTLTGPGGVGKTRLALEAARQIEGDFPDGVFFVSMAGIHSTEFIVPVIADTLGLMFSGSLDPENQIISYLRHREILLVLDNFEHILAGAVALSQILQQVSKVKMLLTSREQLHLQWEWVFDVQGLPVPEQMQPGVLEANSAVVLFLQRARQTAATLSVTEENAEALIRICRLVDGLPLAIELAASWSRLMSPAEIALELERSPDLLEANLFDVPARHRSIRSVFEHSWDLLTAEERLVLMRLSLFQAGFTRQAAEAVAGAKLTVLASLVSKSLLHHSKSPDRYDLHELIRQYSFARLQDSPDESQASEKYAAYYSQWVAYQEGPFKSAQQPHISQLIRAENGNWHASWHWAVRNQRLDLLRRMIPCLNWYFEVHGYYQEALSAFKAAADSFRALGAPGSLQTAAEISTFAFLLDSLGWFEFRTGNVERAVPLLAEGLELARETGDAEVLYYIHGNWGYLSLLTGDIPDAGRLTQESLRYGRMLTPWHTAIPITVLGIVAYQQGNPTEALQQLTDSLKIWRSVGDPRGLVFCMLYLSMTALVLKDIPLTRSTLEESNAIAEANMDRWAHAFGLDQLGMVCLSENQNEEALALFQKSLHLYREIGDHLNGTNVMIHMGQAYAALQCNSDARRLYLEAYDNARKARWIPQILRALVSFVELENGLSNEIKLAVALSVLSHSSLTPNLRTRCEKIREDLTQALSQQQVEAARQAAAEKLPEAWAQEILK
jgi:predicted ATPase/transcriptional regulator with XRE-family HTH domain